MRELKSSSDFGRQWTTSMHQSQRTLHFSCPRERVVWESTWLLLIQSSSSTPTGTPRTTCRPCHVPIVLDRPRLSTFTGAPLSSDSLLQINLMLQSYLEFSITQRKGEGRGGCIAHLMKTHFTSLTPHTKCKKRSILGHRLERAYRCIEAVQAAGVYTCA